MRSVSTTTARLCLAILSAFTLLTAQAQQNSPFTRYGLGEFYTNQHIVSRSLGGLTAAYADGASNNVGQSINFSNPATYGSLYLVTFDFGVSIDSRTLNSQNPVNKFTTNNFLPTYLTLGVPLNRKKGWGLAFGLKPLSTISYSVENRDIVAGDSLKTTYEGSGGLNQVFVGIGKKWKTFSIGINTGYNFGNKDITTRKAFLNDTVSYYQSKTTTATSFNGLFLSGGLQYEVSLAKKTNEKAKTIENYLLRFGLTGTLQQTMNGLQDLTKQTYVASTNGDLKVDSVEEQTGLKGTILMPATYAAGVTFHKTMINTSGTFEMWSIGAEYTSTQWTKYRFYGQPDKLADSWQFKLGLQFSPDPLASRGYWNNVLYRAGFNMGKDYLDADGNGLKQLGFSLGAGLPIKKWRMGYDNQFTYLNTALQFGKRGSSVNNITESFVQFSLGISLSDLWFIKRKYD